MVRDYMEQLRNLPVEVEESEGTSGSGSTTMSQACSFFLSSLTPYPGTDLNAEALQGICDNAPFWSAEKVALEVEVFLRDLFPAPIRRPRRGQAEVAALSRRKKRRQEYALTQQQWKRDPCKCLRNVLTVNRSVSMPPEDTMVPYWRNVMSQANDSSPGVWSAPQTQENLWGPVSEEEIRGAYPANSTASGPDGLSARQLKAVPRPIICRVLNLFMCTGRPPKYLLESRTVLIPKKPDACEPGDFRPIAVSSVLMRLFHKILANRLMAVLEVDERQRAFTRVDGCGKNIFELDMLLKYHRASFRSLHIASLDMAKAYDSVTHRALQDAMRSKGLPTAMIDYIAYVYENSVTRLAGEGWTSEPIRAACGVKQGDPLSPLLFNCVIDGMLRLVPEDVGADLEGRSYNAMAFADDIVLVTRTAVGLQTSLDSVAGYLDSCGLEVAHR